MELAPGDAVVLRRSGVLANCLGDVANGIGLYRRALERDPLNSHCYNNLGISLQAAGRPVEAEEAYRRSLELAPQRVATRSYLSMALLAQGRRHEALKEGKPSKVKFDVYNAIDVVQMKNGPGWRWDMSTRRSPSASIRAGYMVGRQMNIYRGPGRTWAYGSLSGGLVEDKADGLHRLGPGLNVGDSITIALTIFETSEGTPHHWSPQAGDYRELWKQEMSGVIPPK